MKRKSQKTKMFERKLMKKTKMKIAAFVVAAAMATTTPVPATLFASAAPDMYQPQL